MFGNLTENINLRMDEMRLMKKRSVLINLDKINDFVNQVDSRNLIFNFWNSEQFIQTNNVKDIAQFFFVGNAINFRFWFDSHKNVFEYKGYKGSTAMWVVVRDNPLYLDASYLRDINITKEKGLCDMPDRENRQRALREIGTVLLEKYDGEIIKLCEQCEWDAVKIVEGIVGNFPMWEDNYQGVAFRKRAILFVAMLHGRLLPDSSVKNITKLHCLADYQVPKILRYLGILQYSEELNSLIKCHKKIEYKSEFETEIRKKTIEAIDIICKQLENQGAEVCPLQLDYYLWKLAHDIDEPYHLTETIAY